MEGLGKKVEIAANIAIILVAIMIGVVFLQRYFSSPKGKALPNVPVGMKLSLSNVDWAKNGRTLVLALQEGCHFCSESAPFYQRLVAEASNRNIPLLVVLPQPVEAGRKYLSDLKIPANNISEIPLKSIGVRGTPTLLLVNSNGEVTDGWIGKLPSDKESEVLGKLH